MSEEKKEPVSKIVGKIELKPKPMAHKYAEATPLKQNLGELMKQAMEKAKWKAS